jgi:AraC-like DNA-binding protein
MVDYYLVIGAVVVYVESRLLYSIRYDDLAKAVGVSLPHLRAVFDRYTGQPLAHYVMSRKIARAAFDAVHSSDTFLEIAGRYGFTNPDTFTRAFRRVTGLAPQEFRKRKAHVGRAILCAGVYGVSVTDHQNILKEMNNMNINEQKRVSEGSVILYGVPKVHYGAFGGCTPFPICLKAVANYMGMELDYEDAIVLCGAAFRLVWDTTAWNAGNVDVIFTFDDPALVYRSGIEALGREFKLLGRDGSAAAAEPEKFKMANGASLKDAFIAFIRERIDKGIPVIALGIIGPPEACVITGYRDNGRTLLGWNCFQDSPEFASSVKIDESGYFETSSWWENRDTTALMSMGEETGRPQALKAIIERAILALEPKQHGKYAKGIAAYNAWKKAILDESQFGENMVIPLQVERLMCQDDAMDCLSDGRANAHKYFRKLAERHPEQALYGRLAEQFAACATGAHKMYETLGGWERGDAQMKAMMKSETRRRLGELIDDCKAADERALVLLKELALKLN